MDVLKKLLNLISKAPNKRGAVGLDIVAEKVKFHYLGSDEQKVADRKN